MYLSAQQRIRRPLTSVNNGSNPSSRIICTSHTPYVFPRSHPPTEQSLHPPSPTDNHHQFYTHPKILVTALNGPAVGLSAALISFSDFIYATPHTFLLTPFSSLGLVTEGNASIGFVQRLGISKANEALIMSKRITCEELVSTGFVNKVFDVGSKEDSDKFLGEVLREVDERLGTHLNSESLVKIKELIQGPMREKLDRQGVEEVFAGMKRFMKGVPQEEFGKIARGEKKHKL
jgi:peroxisomal 3,2-trans-enoyl-CoA isomerase